MKTVLSALLLALPAFASPARRDADALPFPQLAKIGEINPPAELAHLWNHTTLSHEKRAQCANTLSVAHSVADRLQAHYWNAGTGYYNGGNLWADANTYENLLNLMLADGTSSFASTILSSSTMKAGASSGTNWQALLAGSNDDAGWIMLAFVKMYDYLNTRGQSGGQQYLNSAIAIYNIIVGQWDGTCGGGLWWSTAHTYKNAVTNQLFLTVSGTLYMRTGQDTFLNNAKLVWTWLSGSGMRNSAGLWNDGLTSSCANNGQETWTYNQGVVASGLGLLYAITKDTNYLTQAEITLDATIKGKTVNNILKESCDNVVAGNGACNNDQANFKGIWTKHLQFYLDNANDAARTAKYSGFLGSQQSAVFHYGTNGNNDIGTCWYAPDQGGSSFTPEASSSGIAAHVAAAKYGPC